MHFTSLTAVAALAAVAIAAPSNLHRHVLHQKREPSERWIKLDRVHSAMKLPMRIGIVQENLDKGEQMLLDISDPESPNYSKYMSTEEVVDFFAPARHRVDAVHDWLKKTGVEAHRISESANKQWVQLDLSAWEAEALLNTKYHFFEHAPTGMQTIGCDEYHVHEDVSEHVDYITPGIRLLATRKPSQQEIEKRTFRGSGGKPLPPLLAPLPASINTILGGNANALCDIMITPQCIMAMYNITPATSAVPGNQLGIFESLADYYAQEDLNLFFATLYPTIPIGTGPTLEGIDGGTAPTNVLNAGPESDLDFQISYPLIYPQKSILFQTDDPIYQANYTFQGFLNNLLDAIDGSYCDPSQEKLDPPYPHNVPGGYKKKKQCGVYKPTNVISVSYGGQEADLDFNYQKRQCAEYLKLGLQGTSFLISSGDSGVGGPAGDDNPNGCIGPNGRVFSPDFPASCPWVTAVGGTLLTGDPNKDEETAVTRFGSGGGFSNIHGQPNYQKKAVSTYLAANGKKYPSYAFGSYGAHGVYNRTGRGYPDVSAVGDNVVIFNRGLPMLIGGTSASAPVFASIITRINNERLKAGKRPVGFINKALYANPQVLHDITVGNNPGCNTTGFDVSKGWDPVTGLGTPNYPAMLKLFMSFK